MDVESIMLQAKSSEFGLELSVTDSELFQRRFHARRNAARKKGDYFFETLRVRIVSPTIVYLINEDKDGKGSEYGEGDDTPV